MKKKVYVYGPALTRSGYGEHARFVLRSLREKEDLFDIYFRPCAWGNSGWIMEDNEERRWLEGLVRKTSEYLAKCNQTKQRPSFDVSLLVTIPGEWVEDSINIDPTSTVIGITAGVETTKISSKWWQACQVVDKIITISEFSKNTIAHTAYDAQNPHTGEVIKNMRIKTPIEVNHFPARNLEPEEVDLSGIDTDFNFLSVATWIVRKNLEQLVLAFCSEFYSEEVGLILKTGIVSNCIRDRNETENRIRNLIETNFDRDNMKCKVHLLHGDLTDEEMFGLYNNEKVKAYVCSSSGEGWCLPMFEAAQCGVPIVALGWSGESDYLHIPKVKVRKSKSGKKRKKHVNVPAFRKVEYTLGQVQDKAVWDTVIEKDAMWAFPSMDSLKSQMRNTYEHWDNDKETAEDLKKHILQNFDADDMKLEMVDSIWEFTEDEEDWLEELEEIDEL